MIKKNIMFIIPSMVGGGSERVMLTILKYLNRDKFNITLVLLKKEGSYLDELPLDIKLIDLNINSARYAIFKITTLIKRERPDIVFSTLSHLNLLISIVRPLFSKKIKFIARESNTVSIKNKYQKYPRLFNWLYKVFYNNFDLIICQSKYMKDDLVDNYHINPIKTVVINNPINVENVLKKSKDEKILFDTSKVNLIAVGSLSLQKGFDILLPVISKLDDRFHLSILGEGKEKKELTNLVKELKIEEKVDFLGFQDNPYKYMNQADIYILSSRYEGFPNVVLEANLCGTPVVAFKCPGGTREIIEDGINGFLVECEDSRLLMDRIIEASSHTWSNKEIIQLMISKYTAEKIIKKYEDVIEYDL